MKSDNNNTLKSRRRLMLLATAALGAGLVPSLGRLAFADSDGDDDDNHYEESANTSFTLASTGLNAKIVVVGGGMAGATLAKYLRLWGGSGVAVTLVEPNASYTSNIMSNLVLSGSRSLSTLGYSYGSLAAKFGVTVKQAFVTGIDKTAKAVLLSDGTRLAYDRLVLAPGVEFMNAYGLTQGDYAGTTPHAWQAGPQTAELARQLAGMSNGSFVMTIPKAPYRCPPGPYERACIVADYLKTYRGAASKVIVLDENASIQAEKDTFTTAFGVTHAGVVQYEAGVTGIAIDPVAKVVSYLDAVGTPRTINAQVVNPIPPHRATGSSAGGWLAGAGLNNSADGRWCVVDVLSYESTAVPGIHVIGDAASCGLPKAGHVANQEAKICADAIVRLLAGQQPDPAPVANSACYSPITASTASWLTAVYQYDAVNRKMVVAANGGNPLGAVPTASATVSNKNYKNMSTWFNTLMGDSFA